MAHITKLQFLIKEYISKYISEDDGDFELDEPAERDFDADAAASQADAIHDAWRDDMALHPSEHPDAAAEAHKRGLTYDGWGFWKDNTGKRVAKTQGGKLYSLEQEPQAQASQQTAQSTEAPQQEPSREDQLQQREQLLAKYMSAMDKWHEQVKQAEETRDKATIDKAWANTAQLDAARKALYDFDAAGRERWKAKRDANLEKQADLDAYERAHEKGLKTT